MLDVKSTREQAREVTSLIRELADIVPVAVCSGNHDNAGGLVSHDRASLYKWLVDLGAHPNIVTDGVTLRAHPLVEALNDGVTPELLKRISAEIVLTADDIELALDAQERVAAES